ncbi:MAG: S8 family serine peptidase [Gemmatimonadota bacterium]|nr:S8 family serine peptidase [Gemmatimonadota bacterium]
MSATDRTAVGRTRRLTLAGTIGALLWSAAPALSQDLDRVSSELRAAASALDPGATMPVVVEFSSPLPAPGGPLSVVIPRLLDRSAQALRPLDEVGPADPDVRVTERFWILPAATADVTATGLARLAELDGVRRIVSDAPLPVVLDPAGQSFAPPSFTSDAMITIGADAAWDAGVTGSGTTVAFFDSGVDVDNAMLSRRWRGRRTSVRASWFDPFRRASLPQDLVGHGTQVAVAAVGALPAGDRLELADGSTIVAASNIDVVTGPAPEAEWIAARVFENFGGEIFSRRSVLLQAYQWALDPDGNPTTDDAPDVINNSWGILPTGDFDLCGDVLYAAIDAAEAAGIAVLFASGNTGPAPGSVAFPAARDDPAFRNFAVGATSGTTTIAVAGFSGRGPSPCGGGLKPELVAPGTVPQVVADGSGRARLTGFTVQGTSFSVAQASGAVALVRQVRPGVGPEQAKRFLTDNAVEVGVPGPDNDSGFGLLDVPAALTAAGTPVSSVFLQVAEATADESGVTVRLRNRGARTWPGGLIGLELDGRSLASGRLPAIGAAEVLAVRLTWPVGAPAAGLPVRVIVSDAGGVLLSRLVFAGPPDLFGGFVLTAGQLSAGANDFGRLGRIAALSGFVWQGIELLPAAGLAVAAGPVVSDGMYATTLGRSDLKVFAPAAETDWAPSRSSTDVQPNSAVVRFDDFEALTPAGIEVSATYRVTESAGVGALSASFTAANRSGQRIPDVAIGLLADWDLGSGETVRWSPELAALVTEPASGGGPITILAGDTTVVARAEIPLGIRGALDEYIGGSGVLADSLTDPVKLSLMRGTPASSLPGSGSATDNAALLGLGPFDVAAGGAVSVRFWLLVAPDEAAAAVRLTELRDEMPPPPGGDGTQFAALPPFPNPLRVGDGVVRFPFSLADADIERGGDMRLEVYDLGGRRLVRQTRTLAPGGSLPEFTWDGRLDRGREAAAGVYLYVIRFGDRAVSGRLLLLR